MNLKRLYFILVVLFFISCKEDSNQREADHLRSIQKQDSIFKNINKAWQFSVSPFSSEIRVIIQDWNDWKNFQQEITQKPKGTLNNFRQKITTISNLAEELDRRIPIPFQKLQIESRIAVMITKIKALESLIELDDIPDHRVIELFSDINEDIQGLQQQMENTTVRRNTHLEEGEAEILNSLKASKTKRTTPE